MATFEEEFKRQEPVFRRLSNYALLGKKTVVKGEENFVEGGPNIIVGNHIGSFKDVATIYQIVPRPFFFTGNEMFFNKDDFNFLIRKHLRRHLKNFGVSLDIILTPLKTLFVNYASNVIGKIGTIPVDIYQKKTMTIRKCQDYLKNGRAIIALQGRGRVMKKDLHPYVPPFRRGPSIISYNLYKKDGISVPVTPIAMFGTHVPFLIPAKIKVNVGEPMYITDYLGDDFTETVNRFREALEKRVKILLAEFF